MQDLQGDRPDLLFRAAARVRANAHARHDPHGGRRPPQAPPVPLFHRRRAAPWRKDPQRRSQPRSRGALLYALGRFLVYEPLKNVLGLSRVRVAYTAGEAIGPDLFSFYRSLGLNLKQLYGQTEAFLYVTAQPDGQIHADTVGPAVPNVDMRIAENGEVLFRSPGMFIGYFKDDGQDRRGAHRRRLCEDGRCRLLRCQDRASEDHRPGQGRRAAQRRHAVCAEIHREQAQVLSQHPRSRCIRRRARLRLRHAQYRPHGGRQLGRAQQRGLRLLSGARRPSARLRDDRRDTSRR